MFIEAASKSTLEYSLLHTRGREKWNMVSMYYLKKKTMLE